MGDYTQNELLILENVEIEYEQLPTSLAKNETEGWIISHGSSMYISKFTFTDTINNASKEVLLPILILSKEDYNLFFHTNRLKKTKLGKLIYE